MAKQIIDIGTEIGATPAAVWAPLGDSSTWPDWTPIEEVDIERPAGADGLGEIRNFKTGRVTVREEIVERVPERRLTYVLLGGLAVRDYRAEITLAPSSAGTQLRWHTEFVAKVPGTGWLYRRALEKATRDFVEGLAAHAASAPGARG